MGGSFDQPTPETPVLCWTCDRSMTVADVFITGPDGEPFCQDCAVAKAKEILADAARRLPIPRMATSIKTGRRKKRSRR